MALQEKKKSRRGTMAPETFASRANVGEGVGNSYNTVHAWIGGKGTLALGAPKREDHEQKGKSGRVSKYYGRSKGRRRLTNKEGVGERCC